MNLHKLLPLSGRQLGANEPYILRERERERVKGTLFADPAEFKSKRVYSIGFNIVTIYICKLRLTAQAIIYVNVCSVHLVCVYTIYGIYTRISQWLTY